MAERSRIQKWRESKRRQGLKAVTVWMSEEEELRLKDLAVTWRLSPNN